jgi:hypothetical protein
MPTDRAAVSARDANVPMEVERAATVASVWLVFYLIALVMALADQTIARAIELSSRY